MTTLVDPQFRRVLAIFGMAILGAFAIADPGVGIYVRSAMVSLALVFIIYDAYNSGYEEADQEVLLEE